MYICKKSDKQNNHLVIKNYNIVKKKFKIFICNEGYANLFKDFFQA